MIVVAHEPEEGRMKRKGHRSIPDFSKKKASSTPHVPTSKLDRVAPPPKTDRSITVRQATSAKSGQRGR
jgi:hypothetical protein